VGVLATFAPPTGGWAVNTIYTSTQLVFFPDGPTTSSSSAIETVMYNAAGNALNPDFTPAWSSGGTVGTSTSTAWIDQSNHGPGSTYTPADAVTVTDPNTSGPVSIRIALATAAVLTPNGRCCLAGGACVLATSAECTGLAGTYGGDGTACAGSCPSAPVLWNNGPLATGSTSLSGTAAPAGGQWSEFPKDGNCTINTFGLSASSAGPFRLADDFTVPTGATWNVSNVDVYGYLTGGSTTVPPWTAITLRIIRDDPDTGTVVFGDTTTNLLTSPSTQATFTNTYRIANPQGSPGNAITNRGIWQYELPVSVSLPAGHYYIDFNNTGGGFVPPVTVMNTPAAFGVASLEGANGRQFQPAPINRYLYGGTGGAAITASGATGCVATTVEIPFLVKGTATQGSTCYANCDNSTQLPFLNVQDFSCFLTKYAAGNSYANCDNSTQIPVLNVQDFSCFLTKYAAGCSAP